MNISTRLFCGPNTPSTPKLCSLQVYCDTRAKDLQRFTARSRDEGRLDGCARRMDFAIAADILFASLHFRLTPWMDIYGDCRAEGTVELRGSA